MTTTENPGADAPAAGEGRTRGLRTASAASYVGDGGAELELRANETRYRSYEVYQRERPAQSTTQLLKGRELWSREYLENPYRLLTILREHVPCYRDWFGNAFWVTGYDDVTSVLHDEANYETRSRLHTYERDHFGRDLRDHLPVLVAEADGMRAHARASVAAALTEVAGAGSFELALGVGARAALALRAAIVGVDGDDAARLTRLLGRIHRGLGIDPVATQAGREAMDELAALCEPLLAARRAEPRADLLSAIAGLELPDGPATGADAATTLLEADHETLHGALVNLWFLLLTNDGAWETVRDDRRLVKLAYLETLRHSPPVLSGHRHARHEVERFGRLLPEGALVICSAAAANRDPRQFADPDTFVIDRRDMCQREPRGSYRADGLPSGVAPGLGQPSKFPAVPEDRPPSRYALVRDAVAAMTQELLDTHPDLRLADGATPVLRSLRIGEMRTCWDLPVVTG